MLRDHSLLSPARSSSRKSNKSQPYRRDQHDARTEKLTDRSPNLTDDRTSSDDGPGGLGPDTTAKDMDVEQTASPDYAIRPNRRRASTLSALQSVQPCQEKVKTSRSTTINGRACRAKFCVGLRQDLGTGAGFGDSR